MEEIYTTPNPFGIFKKIPKKLIGVVLRITRLDRILLEVFLATITVPDEKLRQFLETRLQQLLVQLEEPIRKATEGFGETVLEPLFNAIPGVPFIRLLDSVKKGSDALEDVQASGAAALNSAIQDFRDLYNGIEGPHRLNTSLMLGIGQYLSKLEEKVKRGETLTKDDLNQGNWLVGIGHDTDVEPAKEDPRRAAARALVTSIAERYMEQNPDGLNEKDTEFVKQFEEAIGKLVEDETTNETERGLLERLMGTTTQS